MKDRWTELCELAVTELDRAKFRAILQELNQLLDEKRPAPAVRRVQWDLPHENLIRRRREFQGDGGQ